MDKIALSVQTDVDIMGQVSLYNQIAMLQHHFDEHENSKGILHYCWVFWVFCVFCVVKYAGATPKITHKDQTIEITWVHSHSTKWASPSCHTHPSRDQQ